MNKISYCEKEIMNDGKFLFVRCGTNLIEFGYKNQFAQCEECRKKNKELKE